MRTLAERLRGLEQLLSEEKGPFKLFALFLREGAPNVWDLVVAADWIDKNQSRCLGEIASRVQAYLRPAEIVNLSRVVIVDAKNPAVREIASAVPAGPGIVEMTNVDYFDLPMKRAFIITARADAPAKKVAPRRAAAGGRR
jgi:hypothetical protein